MMTVIENHVKFATKGEFRKAVVAHQLGIETDPKWRLAL